MFLIFSDFHDDLGNPSPRMQFYYTPWNHALVYFAGFIFGYFVYNGIVKLRLEKVFKDNKILY